MVWQQYCPEGKSSGGGITGPGGVPLLCIPQPFCGSSFLPSLFQQTGTVEAATSHSTFKGLPTSRDPPLSASKIVEYVTGRAIIGNSGQLNKPKAVGTHTFQTDSYCAEDKKSFGDVELRKSHSSYTASDNKQLLTFLFGCANEAAIKPHSS